MAEIKRLNYFNFQFLVDRDFEDEQAYHLQMRRRHNRQMHTPGVADGFTVTKAAANQVRISPGTAIDRDGREIVLDDARVHTLVTGGNNVDVFLAISYQDVSDPADRYTQGGIDDFTRVTERPKIEDTSSAPPADSPALLLARIRLNATGVIESDAAINTTVRVVAFARLAPKSVTTAQLADGTVTLAKLAAEAQPTAAIVDALGGVNRIVTQINAGNGIIARSRVEPEVISSVVSFQSLPLNVEVSSNDIDPGFGPGVVGVQLGLDDFETANASVSGDGSFGRTVLLRSQVNRDTGTFRIFAKRTAAGGPTQAIRVRWYACRPQLVAESSATISVSVTPATTNLAGNTTQVFTGVVSNLPTAGVVNWSITEANAGTLSGTTGATVTYTSPVLSGTYHVVATSAADPSKSSSATITVTAAIAVNPSRTSANLIPNQFVDISADVINTTNKGITWSVPAGGGTLSTPNSPATRYTAPAAAGTYIVTATSVADPTKTATISMNVVAVAVSAAADATTIDANSQTVVRATITPPFADNRANWALASGGGSISPGQGTTTTYSAPSSGTTATIVATSVADSSKTRTVTITVNPPPVSPGPPVLPVRASGPSMRRTWFPTAVRPSPSRVSPLVQRPRAQQSSRAPFSVRPSAPRPRCRLSPRRRRRNERAVLSRYWRRLVIQRSRRCASCCRSSWCTPGLPTCRAAVGARWSAVPSWRRLRPMEVCSVRSRSVPCGAASQLSRRRTSRTCTLMIGSSRPGRCMPSCVPGCLNSASACATSRIRLHWPARRGCPCAGGGWRHAREFRPCRQLLQASRMRR